VVIRKLSKAGLSARHEVNREHITVRWPVTLNRSAAFFLLFCVALPLFGQQSSSKPEGTQPKAESVSDSDGSEYLVGAGDVLSINVWKEPELSLDHVAVRPDGMLSMPLIGAVRVGGMSVSQIQGMLAEKLHRFVSIARVTVTVSEIRSRLVYITGEVNRPGVYPLLASSDVLQIIIRAGGLSPFARRKSIYILRSVDGKQQKIPVNYVRLLRGDGEQNVQIQAGDTVVIP
jgi:polysaccharide export outer membrane protein